MNILRASIALGAFAVAGLASADPLTVSGLSGGNYQAVNIALNGGTLSVYAGPQAATYGTGSFDAYCVDLLHNQPVPVTFDVIPTAAAGSLSNGARVAQLVNAFSSTVASSDQGAALQLAIWDVLYDDGDGLGAGSFTASNVSAGASTFFSAYLADPLTGVSTVATYYNPTSHGPNGDIYQGLIGPGGDNLTPDAVPEPASLAALGLGGLALLRRRKRA